MPSWLAVYPPLGQTISISKAFVLSVQHIVPRVYTHSESILFTMFIRFILIFPTDKFTIIAGKYLLILLPESHKRELLTNFVVDLFDCWWPITLRISLQNVILVTHVCFIIISSGSHWFNFIVSGAITTNLLDGNFNDANPFWNYCRMLTVLPIFTKGMSGCAPYLLWSIWNWGVITVLLDSSELWCNHPILITYSWWSLPHSAPNTRIISFSDNMQRQWHRAWLMMHGDITGQIFIHVCQTPSQSYLTCHPKNSKIAKVWCIRPSKPTSLTWLPFQGIFVTRT